MKTALLAGSTGLIGNQLLHLLLESSRYDKVIALTRQPLESHPKLLPLTPDFDNLETEARSLHADDVYCCLGTTMAKAGSKEKFYEVDFHYPNLLARATFAAGARQYLLVSALGANKKSAVYYNRVKGEIEEAVSTVGFQAVHLFRPSLLLGPRTEKRSGGEDAAKVLYKLLGFLIPQKYKSIESLKVAKAMLHFASQDKSGIFIHESTELQGF